MDVFELFGNFDERKENEGIWYDLGQGARVKVARYGNEKYRVAIRKFNQVNNLRIDIMTEAEKESAFQEIESETVFLDFEGVTLKGEPIKNSIESRKKLMAIRGFRMKIIEIADKAELFKNKKEAEDIATLGK